MTMDSWPTVYRNESSNGSGIAGEAVLDEDLAVRNLRLASPVLLASEAQAGSTAKLI